MRVLVVNHYAVPGGAGGGTRHVDLARHWAQDGHSTVIVASSFNHFAPGRRLAPVTPIADGAELRARWTPGYAGNGIGRVVDMLWFAAGVSATRKRSLDRPDVVIGSTPHPLAAYGALRLARRLRVPFVLEIRDLWPQTLIDLGGLSAASPIARALFRLEASLLRSAALVVYVPPAADNYFRERGLRLQAAVHVPNATTTQAPDPDLRHPVLDVIDEQHREGRVVFSYTGALGHANDLPALIAAAHLAADKKAFLLICGDGPERPGLESLLQGGPGNVQLVGQVPKPVAFAVQRASDANVFHLRPAAVFRYGLSPNKLADYLMSGRPLLYAGPEVDNPAGRAGSGVVAAPSDPSSIAAAMVSIISMSAEERSSRGARGRAFAEVHHTTERTSRDYIDALGTAIESLGRRTPAAFRAGRRSRLWPPVR